MAEASDPTTEKELCLYQVALNQLFSENDLNTKIIQSLANISQNQLHEGNLKSISNDPRCCLYVLIDSNELVNQGSLTVYSAIQVCLEGNIPGNGVAKSISKSISDTFVYFPRLNSKSLVGAQVLHVFEVEDGYGSALLDVLTRHYDGAAAQNPIAVALPLIIPEQTSVKLHYMGAYLELNGDDAMAAIHRWEEYNFSVFFVVSDRDGTFSLLMLKPLHAYESEISGNDDMCSVSNVMAASRTIFVRRLRSDLRNLDHELALRLLKGFSSVIHADGVKANNIWTERERQRVDAFLMFPEKVELITDLVGDLARLYFDGKLPAAIQFSDAEEASLLCLFQNKVDPLQENVTRERLGSILEKAAQVFDSLSPEVLDH